MVQFLPILKFVLVRPLVVPVVAGLVGLWVGTYDVSYIASNTLLPFVIKKTENSKSSSASWMQHFVGASGGGLLIYIRTTMAPNMSIDWKEVSQRKWNKETFKFIVQSLKLPGRYHLITVMASGSVGGIITATIKNVSN